MRRQITGRRLWPWISGLLFLLASALPAAGQRLEWVSASGPVHHIRIDGRDYLAMPIGQARRQLFVLDSLQAEIRSLRQKITAQDSLIAALERTNRAYARHFALQDTLLARTQQLYRGYRDLYFRTKAISGEPWLHWSGGIGAVRDTDTGDILPVLLFGLTVRRLSLWGFLHQRQSGFLFGVTQPVRLPWP